MSSQQSRISLPFKRKRSVNERHPFVIPVLLCATLLSGAVSTMGAEAEGDSSAAEVSAQGSPTSQPMYIREYRVKDAHQLKPIEVQKAVYPFLGPGRTAEDVEHARAALEEAYKEKGFQSVSVQIPPQEARHGIVILQVFENPVGRLRVKGSRYFSIDQIKGGAPSIAEGKVANFKEITRDIINLNQLPDRQVTPSLRPGMEPNTVDVDLTVKDTFPLHGSLELNNRYSADTTELRLNGAVSYNNLWQLGHSAGASFQVSPESLDEVKVFSGFYTARIPSLPKLSFTLQGTKQDSNVSTLGGAAVAGRGEVIGGRMNVTLPAGTNFYQFFNFGLDYKRFDQNVVFATGTDQTPITYYPITAAYGATWTGKGRTTEFNADLTFHLRGMGSRPKLTGTNQDGSLNYESAFYNRRFNSDGDFIYLRGDLSHTQELPRGFQAYGKVQGQISSSPLIDSEEFAGGGLGTARGYLESTALGDNAIFGTVELRSPPMLPWFGEKNEWRIYGFCDGGVVTVRSPQNEQQSRFDFASVGVGSRLRLMDHFSGSIDAGLPLTQPVATSPNDLLLTFRLWAEF